ncbi:RdRP-domain-containing protein [Russula emetica]|nr:RdRP-domain-containing protein [Russula emetica]
MELFIRDLSSQATSVDIKCAFADELHSPRYLPQSGQLWNFHVKLFPPRRKGQAHGGCGKVTVPEEYLGHCLLQDFGGNSRRLSIAGKRIQLKTSKDAPDAAILEKIRHEPYVSPEVEQRLAEIHESFQQKTVEIHTLQLGWETRGGVFSVEWEKEFQADCHLAFSDTRREIRIRHIEQPNIVLSIAIPWSQISWSATYHTDEGHPAIFLSLYSPPIFDTENTYQALIQSVLGPQVIAPLKRQRVLELYPDDGDFIRVLPYTTLSIRLLCRRTADLKTFKTLCKTAHLSAPKDYRYHAEHLALFSENNLERYRRWTSTLDWSVAFQLESLLRGRIADANEIFSIRRIVTDMLDHKGADHTANFLRFVAHDPSFEVQGVDEGAFADAIERYANDFSWSPSPHPWGPKDGIFNCLHVSISPTSMTLGGPYPERSNRVLRTYADNYDSFIRVSFVEETKLRYQQDREIDGPAFIGRWVSPVLHNGFTIAGRQFQFLAYSQSALKTHTVWFVKNFRDPEGNLITAATIIERLGTFHDVECDRKLIYCPARYAARISQAFTTTDSSVSVPAEEIILEDDIESEDGKYCFTDGVGTMSAQIARKIWRAFQKRGSRSTRRNLTYSRAFQIRLGGAKGMLSVDHKLKGDLVILRPSMIKFNAPHSTDVEIARAFVRPSKYYLNRPLIMVLEGLGIRYEVFKKLQDAAVREVNDATTSLEKAAKTMDQFGLASSYRLSSTLVHLAKLDIIPSIMGDFYDRMIEITIHHVLRDLKHHARIPVDEGYTLVGVADIHGYLQEGEVFACATISETGLIHYLEGDVLVSRSPIIHPGDVQVVRAIGQPPLGSPFNKEPLMNTIVFSVKGTRPLSSCLGGGDLDGDVYNVAFLEDLHPSQNFRPAEYKPATRKELSRPSTMDDVADFVADYINSDILGLVAINWLLIADLNGIFHEDCLKLCQIHSDAVDYPKNGTPVSIDTVPKPKSKHKPDWQAPETVDLNSADNFYPSSKAIGRLFRAIDLSEVQTHVWAARRKRHQVREDQPEADLDEVFAALCMNDREDDPLESVVKSRVAEFISVDDPDSESVKLTIESLDRYSIDLQGICACNAIQRHKTATLSEEEAVVGTIVAKCSQRRKRKDAMSQLREQTSFLVKGVRDELSGDDDSSQHDWLATAWTAWKVSRQLKDRFGAHSYGWIALGEVFDAMKAIEQDKTG